MIKLIFIFAKVNKIEIFKTKTSLLAYCFKICLYNTTFSYGHNILLNKDFYFFFQIFNLCHINSGNRKISFVIIKISIFFIILV